jgi:hypothetical protein
MSVAVVRKHDSHPYWGREGGVGSGEREKKGCCCHKERGQGKGRYDAATGPETKPRLEAALSVLDAHEAKGRSSGALRRLVRRPSTQASWTRTWRVRTRLMISVAYLRSSTLDSHGMPSRAKEVIFDDDARR